MKLRLLAVALFLLGIVCLAQQSSAQLGMTGVGGGFGAGSAAPTWTPGAQVVPQDAAFSGSSSTFTGMNGGTNYPSGAVVEAFIANDQGAAISSVKIGGVSGQSASAVSGAADSSGKCQLFQATLSASETDSIVVNYSVSTVAYIAAVAGYFQNLSSSTATASANEPFANQGDPQFPTSTLTVPASGFGLAFVMTGQATVPTALSWQTATPSFITGASGDVYSPFTGTAHFAVGMAHTITAGSGWQAKVSGVTTNMNFVACMSAATWH